MAIHSDIVLCLQRKQSENIRSDIYKGYAEHSV